MQHIDGWEDKSMASQDENFEKVLDGLSKGNRKQARIDLRVVLTDDNKNLEAAWFAARMVANSRLNAMQALTELLKANPSNSFALRELDRIFNEVDETAYDVINNKEAWNQLSALVLTKRQKDICNQKILELETKDKASYYKNNLPMFVIKKTIKKGVDIWIGFFSRFQQVRQKKSTTLSNPIKNKRIDATDYSNSRHKEPIELKPSFRSSSSLKKDENLQAKKEGLKISKRLNLFQKLLMLFVVIILPFNTELEFMGIKLELTILLMLLIACLYLATQFVNKKLLDKRTTFYWGTWYVIIPFILICLKGNYKSTDIIAMILLYFLLVNTTKEANLLEFGVASIISIATLMLVKLGYIHFISINNGINPGEWITIQSFVSIGICISPRKWMVRILGGALSATVIYFTMLFYPNESVGLYLIIIVMILAWLTIRDRLRDQLPFFVVTCIVAAGLIVSFNRAGPISGFFHFIEISKPYSWIIAIFPVIPVFAALFQEKIPLKKGGGMSLNILVVIIFFNGLQTALALFADHTTLSLESFTIWLLCNIIQLLIQTLTISLLIVVFFIVGGKSGSIYITISGVIITFVPIIIGSFLIYRNYPAVWLPRSLAIAQVSLLLTSFVIGLLVFCLDLIKKIRKNHKNLSLGFSLGCGGAVFIVILLVVITSVILKTPELSNTTWAISISLMLGMGAWRSQRPWGIVFTAGIIGICILSMITSTNWFTPSSTNLLILLLGLWVEKDNTLPISIDSLKYFA